MVVGYATVGALIASRRPRNAVGWLMLALALVFAVQVAAAAYVWTASNPGYVAVAWVQDWIWYLWLGLLGIFLPLLFPEGRLPSSRWRPVTWLGALAVLTGTASVALKPGRMPIDAPIAVSNPLGVADLPASTFHVAERMGAGLFLLAVLLTATALVIRFRRADGVERQQLKWFAFAGVVTLAGLALGALAEMVLLGQGGQLAGAAGWSMFLAGALLGIPVATGVAMFRHHLYDIDLVIRRTLVYGALTTALLATYVGLVLLLRLALSPLTGDSDLAVAVSTLAVAALFRPARRRIQTTVDRRFYRRRYDATRTVEEFSTRLRHHLDLDTVGADLCTAATDTVQPAHVSLWLRP
jgi:hypothetical protein